MKWKELGTDYLVMIGLSIVVQTYTWKSNIIPQIGYLGNVVLFSAVFITSYHIGVLRGSKVDKNESN